MIIFFLFIIYILVAEYEFLELSFLDNLDHKQQSYNKFNNEFHFEDLDDNTNREDHLTAGILIDPIITTTLAQEMTEAWEEEIKEIEDSDLQDILQGIFDNNNNYKQHHDHEQHDEIEDEVSHHDHHSHKHTTDAAGNEIHYHHNHAHYNNVLTPKMNEFMDKYFLPNSIEVNATDIAIIPFYWHIPKSAGTTFRRAIRIEWDIIPIADLKSLHEVIELVQKGEYFPEFIVSMLFYEMYELFDIMLEKKILNVN